MSATLSNARHEGIVVKHRAGCASGHGAPCNCRRVYQAAVWSARDAKRIRKHFDSLSDARSWRADSYSKLRRRELRAPSRLTFAEAAALWLAGARAGAIRTRSGDAYKPSTIRSYELALLRPRNGGDGGLVRELGPLRLSELSCEDVQAYADRLLAAGAEPSTIRNAVMPLRVICRWRRREVAVNPTAGLSLPAVHCGIRRIASPAEAELLLAALAARDRPLWATALYAGLRRGELMGLRWSDVDLARGLIDVSRAWDPKERAMVAPKSQAGSRRVPIASALRAFLAPASLAAPPADGLLFGRAGQPFCASSLYERAHRAWRRARLEPISLHDCRHTFASMMIAAGVNAKALSTFMGHANISITLDRYGHLMPGAEDEAAGLMDAYLQGARATTS